MADASDARKLEVDWQRRAELAAAQTAAAVAEARAFQQETVAARAQAAATVRVGSPTDPRTPRRTSGVRTEHLTCTRDPQRDTKPSRVLSRRRVVSQHTDRKDEA